MLAGQNWARIAAGQTADAVHADAVAAADYAYGLLRDGIGAYCG